MVIADNLYDTAAPSHPHCPSWGNHFPTKKGLHAELPLAQVLQQPGCIWKWAERMAGLVSPRQFEQGSEQGMSREVPGGPQRAPYQGLVPAMVCKQQVRSQKVEGRLVVPAGCSLACLLDQQMDSFL